MILAGDLGATKSNLALFSVEGHGLKLVVEQTLRSKDYPGVKELVAAFLGSDPVRDNDRAGAEAITRACLGIAGPVVGDQVRTPNLPWLISAPQLGEDFGLEAVKLINDLEATGYGISTLDSGELLALSEASPQPNSNGALIAAGTGLGEGLLIAAEHGLRPVASEGGHCDFAPRTALETKLLEYLLERFSHVSYERVLSGPGLLNIYRFLRDSGGGDEPAWLKEKLKQGDPSAIVTREALAGQSELCVQTLDLFVSIYGAEAGNLGLKAKALGGVYVGGGIAPRIKNKLVDGTFMEGFTDKGRLSQLMESIPVHVILNPKTALFGAAHYATLSG